MKKFIINCAIAGIVMIVGIILTGQCSGEKLSKELDVRNALTKQIIDIYPILYVDEGPNSQMDEGFRFLYQTVQDAYRGHNIDSVFNRDIEVKIPDWGNENTKRFLIGRQLEEQLAQLIKPNPDYVAEGVTAVLEIFHQTRGDLAPRDRITVPLGYILVNDRKELKTIEENIENLGTIVVLMRYNADSESYKRTMGGKTTTSATREGMAIYFYDCRKKVVFDNFAILADPLPDKAVSVSSTRVTSHLDEINKRLKTNLKGKLSYSDLFSLW